MMNLAELKEKIKSYYPVEPDLDRLENAYQFAVGAHQGQKRFSGELYITHPLGVSTILAELEMDMDTIVAGLLHDVVEDTEVTLEDIEERYGKEIAMLVDGVTKLSKLEYKSKEERQAENLRKMFIAMAKDIRVLLIKLADRTHNMRTLKYLTSIKQQIISQETLEIYAPLAHRLGIYKIKWELEDLAFRFLERDRYYALVDRLAKKRQEREAFIGQILDSLQPKLADVGVKAQITGRPKHLYSISQKMKEQGKEFHEIYDLTAIRILVDSLKDCYGALGIVHTLWKPIPGKFKDYIAMPKPNMYQSLHTLVMVGKNELLEVQIRTWDMHRTAEYGIAAHWRYKEGDGSDDNAMDNKLTWLRQIMELQQDSSDAREFMENVKIDLFADEVFVFTPKGDVIDLPAGSIPLDFAYKIHTDIGHRCIGARVNGRLVPLDYELNTGDIVEVMTAKQGSPSRDWLKMVQSSGARAKIRTWFKKERRDENLSKGKDLLEKELRKQELEFSLYMKPAILQEAAKRFNIHSEEDFYVSIGLGGITPQQAVGRMKEECRKKYGPSEEPEAIREFKPHKAVKKTGKGVKIAGIDNLLIRFAKCCTPVPGDRIVGVVTRGRGVSVHRSDCPNVVFTGEKPNHHLEAGWESEPDGNYPVDIEVSAMDRAQILMDVVNAVAECKVNITAMNGRSTKDGRSQIHMTLNVADRGHLDDVIKRINRVKDVYRVHRLSG